MNATDGHDSPLEHTATYLASAPSGWTSSNFGFPLFSARNAALPRPMAQPANPRAQSQLAPQRESLARARQHERFRRRNIPVVQPRALDQLVAPAHQVPVRRQIVQVILQQ